MRPEEEENQENDPQQEVDALEGDPPADLEEWPDGDAKYKTFGGPEGESSYDEGPTSQLGDSDVRHHEDGSVTVGGEKVDNPEDYKGDPIPGGPTDPNTRGVPGERDLEDDEGGGGGDDDG